MATKEKKTKCVTFWIEKDLIESFDKNYHAKSFFIRECIKKAINDREFYINMTCSNNEKK